MKRPSARLVRSASRVRPRTTAAASAAAPPIPSKVRFMARWCGAGREPYSQGARLALVDACTTTAQAHATCSRLGMARAIHPDAKWWQGERGRQAERPQEIPARGWVDILKRVKERISRSRLSIIAAGVAFYALMAVPPALIALRSEERRVGKECGSRWAVYDE